MPSYKLYYFHFRGRAEIIRLAFALGNIPYEDVRLDWDQWAKEKLCEYYINFPEDEYSKRLSIREKLHVFSVFQMPVAEITRER